MMAESRTPVVETQGLGRTFGGVAPVRAVRDVDLTIFGGEFVSIMGRSGSGKSTLLNLLGLLDRPSDGSYRLHGIETRSLSGRSATIARAKTIGFVFQSFHLIERKTALENVMLAGLYQGESREVRAAQALAAVRRVDLLHRKDSKPSALSGGEQQRVAIARALAGSPDLLLADEPTGNLDTHTAAGVLDMLEGLNNDGLTVVVVTHDPAVARRANRWLEMTDGHLGDQPHGRISGSEKTSA